MMTTVEICAEVARIYQKRSRQLGTPYAAELARLIVEEMIINEDAQGSFLIAGDGSLSSDDALVQALGVNDINVNGSHIDIRVLDAEGSVSIDSALVGTSYLANGSLVVRLSGPLTGEICGYISGTDWQAAQAAAGKAGRVSVSRPTAAAVNLAALLGQLNPRSVEIEGVPVVSDAELMLMVVQRNQLDGARTRQIAEALIASQELRGRLTSIAKRWSRGTIANLMSEAGQWASRVEKLVDRLYPRFSRLSRQEVREIVVAVGQEHGGQPDTPGFRKAVLAYLTEAELAKEAIRCDRQRMSSMVSRVLAGISPLEAVREFVRSKVAVDIALAIRQRRQDVGGFLEATAEELGAAFQQLALQPVYATHSKEEGLEAINEALLMLQAGELAEKVRDIESEMIGS